MSLGSLFHHLLWGIVRVVGYVAAFPGNLVWKIGYNGYYGLSGGKVVIVGSQPVTPTVTPTASAPVTTPQTAAA